jgi:UDP-N-acetylmuramoyl-tripeptide--D-alanyl-D-alanine ligase
LAVLWREDEHFEQLRGRSRARRCVTFGRHRDADVRLSACRQQVDGLALAVNGHDQVLPVFGEANGLNAAAACAMAVEMGVTIADALRRMAQATLSPHRSHLITRRGRTILDDCYNANPASMKAALDSLASLPVTGRRVAVLGSMFELGDASDALHREVLEHARGQELTVVAVGDPMASMVREAETGSWTDLPAEYADLGRALAQRSRPGDALLFKASRSVGLEAVLEVMLAELEAQTLGMV